MARLYKDFIKVDPNFIPVFSKNSDKIYPDKWQSFYPHDSFKDILNKVVETLEKGNETKDHSIWMSGAYGTGKTYASFVIKHILEDEIASIEPYFVENNMQALLARVKGIRAKGKILVVQKSASAGIDKQNKLFNAIIEAVKETLKAEGYDYTGSKSLLDKVITTLKDPNSSFNFVGAFNKYRSRFTDYDSPQGVIEDLETLDLDEKLELLDTIVEVADMESFTWALSPEEVINWLEDVRKGNNIYSIMFIWDEFTEYFKNNQNNITGLQEVAMADSRINFYFFLITHSAVGQLIQDQQARKIIEARFKLTRIELEESTAFKLLGQAIRHEPDLLTEWSKIVDELWSGVKRGSVDVIKDKDISVKDSDFKELLPLHPYAAYLLKIIAKDISSNQRTIFQFLSGDYSDDNRVNFKSFIEHNAYEFGKWNYLTADYLWDYFFTSNNVDLDSTFTSIISHYNNYASLCQSDNQRKVLKVTLLLVALQSKNGAESRSGATSLMRPTLANIKACFAGTPLESSVEQELNYFTTKGIIGKIEDSHEVLFVMTSAAIDTERMNSIVEEIKRTISFEKLVAERNYKISEQFEPNDFLKYRLKIAFSTPANVRQIAESLANCASNIIPTIFLYAKNEIEQGKIMDCIKQIYDRIPNAVVVDFSATPFTDVSYQKFIESKAKEKYFSSQSNQKSQCDLAKKFSQDIINEWIRKLIATTLGVYTSADRRDAVTGGSNLRRKLREINAEIFSCGLETISQNDKLFAESGFKETVAQMAMGKISIPANYSYVRIISGKLEADGIWNTPKYYEVKPMHAVSKMKLAVNAVVEKGFENSRMVSVADIWRELKKPPFGLLSNTGSVFILGFLLAEYADSSYYKKDTNSNTVSLNYTDLSELIFAVVKGLPKAEGQYIVKQTKEHAFFCQKTGEIFKIAKEKRNSIDDIAKNINIYLTNNNYPMWSLKYYIEEDMYDHDMKDALVSLTEMFCEFVAPESKIGREKTKVAEDIYRIYVENTGIDDVYCEILNSQNMRLGMEYYIAQYKPDLTQTAGALKIESKEYLAMLNEKLSADSSYLWQIGDTNHQIDNLYVDLRLIYVVNRLLTTKQKTYKEVRIALIEKLNNIKIPLPILFELKPDLHAILEQLCAIRDGQVSNKEEMLRTIDASADEFNDFFNNQFEIFSMALTTYVDSQIATDELDHLYNNTEAGTLFKTIDQFAIYMKRELDKFRKNKKILKMFEAWKNVTGTQNPAEWSKLNGIPILCLFIDNQKLAQSVFAALNNESTMPSESEIDRAISFINSRSFAILKDKEKCDKAFIEYFCGEYSYVVENADGLRDRIRTLTPSSVYEWFFSRDALRKEMIKYSKERYELKYRSKVKDKVRNLSAEDAKKFLDKLIEDDPLLGINILKS